MTPRSMKEWLDLAYGPHRGCPPPEVFLEDSSNELTEEERKRVERHATECPACAAERELARAFDDGAAVTEVRREDVDYVVSRLRSPVGDRGGRIDPAAPGRRRWLRVGSPWGLAAAAAFVVAVFGMFTLLRSPGPPLPAPTGDSVMRGNRVEIVGPAGELDAMPMTLEWREVPGAESYRVRILEVDDTVLWRYTGKEHSQDLPRDVLERMHAAVVYSWEVEALDAAGNGIARSERADFRVRPDARSTD